MPDEKVETRDPSVGLTVEEQAEIDADAAGTATPGAEEEEAVETKTDPPAKVEPAAAVPDPVAVALAESAKATTALVTELAESRKAAAPPEKKEDAPPARDFDKERDDLLAQYDLGEVDIDEYKAGLKKIDGEKDAATKAAFDKERGSLEENILSKARNERAAEEAGRTWGESVNAWQGVETNKDFVADPIRLQVFNAMLATVAKEPAFQGKTHQELLNESRDRVMKSFNMTPGKPGAAQVEAAVKERVKGAPKAPPDLDVAPAGGGSVDEGGVFAKLDAMDVSDREDALGRLRASNPALVDKYLEDAPGGLHDNPRGGDDRENIRSRSRK